MTADVFISACRLEKNWWHPYLVAEHLGNFFQNSYFLMRKIIILYEKNASQEYYQPFLEVAFKNPTTFFFFLTM